MKGESIFVRLFVNLCIFILFLVTNIQNAAKLTSLLEETINKKSNIIHILQRNKDKEWVSIGIEGQEYVNDNDITVSYIYIFVIYVYIFYYHYYYYNIHLNYC